MLICVQVKSQMKGQNYWKQHEWGYGCTQVCLWSEGNGFLLSYFQWSKMQINTFKSRGFIKVWVPGKLTGCERDLGINLPGCFRLLLLLSFIRKTKNARLKNPTDLLHINLMKPLSKGQYVGVEWINNQVMTGTHELTTSIALSH